MQHRNTFVPPGTSRPRRLRVRVLTAVVVLAGVAALTGVTSAIAAPQHHPGARHGNRATTWTLPHIDRSVGKAAVHAPKSHRVTASATAEATTTTTTSKPKKAKRPNQVAVSRITVSPKATATTTGPAATASRSTAAAGADAAGSITRLFSADSPWNTTIPGNAATDPGSAKLVSAVLANPSLVMNLNLYAYGIPFYTATASTPRITLGGRNPLGAVPVDPSWRPNEGADHKMNVIDPNTHTVYELQGYDPGKRTIYWAVKKDYATSLGDGYPKDGLAGPTGSGLTQAGGVIRMSEIASGRIDHALSFITSKPVNRFRYPASHSDGTATGTGLEEGMRIRLDPTLDLDRIPGITPGEKAIARALQLYGAYCTDNGGGNNQAMGFYVETPKPADANPYPAAGFGQDWAQLPHVPRNRLSVLAESATPRP